jgi:Zn-dependent protease with chaperone function
VATLFGTFLGILTALTLSFAIAPYTMRKMLPLRPLQEDAKQNMIKNCFAQAGLAPPETWVIEIDQFRSANAMIAGFTRGKGPFKPALFITKTLLEHFPEEEIKAVVLHEVSHLAFNHLRQRFVLGFLSVIGATLSMALFILVAPKFATLGLLISMAMPFILMRQQNQRQELEADREAILKFGASFEGLAGALRRIDQLNNPQLKLSGGHPATERRLILIRQAAEEALITEEFKRTLEQELIKQPKSNKQKAA